jgi:hypothetical protein
MTVRAPGTLGNARRILAMLLGLGAAAVSLPAASLASSAPRVDVESVSVSENTATLHAQVKSGGLETKYEIWLEFAPCSGGGPCETMVQQRVGGGHVAAGSEAEVLSAEVKSLRWNYSYTFWISAKNSAGEAEGQQGFRTGSEPPKAPSGDEGGSGMGAPYESKTEPWVWEGASNSADEAPQREAERIAKHKEEEERPAKEAAERAAKEREAREAGELAGKEAAERERLAATAAMCVVPSLKGDSLAAARSALHTAHCKLGKVTSPHGRRRHGALVVLSQSHPRGAMLPRASAIAVRLGSRRATR